MHLGEGVDFNGGFRRRGNPFQRAVEFAQDFPLAEKQGKDRGLVFAIHCHASNIEQIRQSSKGRSIFSLK
jgi:hypothetical protein